MPAAAMHTDKTQVCVLKGCAIYGGSESEKGQRRGALRADAAYAIAALQTAAALPVRFVTWTMVRHS